MSSLNSKEEDDEFGKLLGRARDDAERETLKQWRRDCRCPDSPTDDKNFDDMLSELKNNNRLLIAYSMFFERWLNRENTRTDVDNASSNENPEHAARREDLLLEPYEEPSGAAAEGDAATSNESSPVDLLESALKDIIAKSDQDGISPEEAPAPFVCLVQSTGYGKTRAVLELAKTRKVVYLIWKDLEGSWSVPEVLSKLLKDLEATSENDDEYLCEKKWIKFLTAVKTCAEMYKSAKELREAQVNKDAELGEFYDQLLKVWKASDTPEHSPMRSSLKKAVSSSDHQKGGRKKVNYETATKITNDSIVVCLDEVPALQNNAFRAFRRAAKQTGVLSIFCDTATSICELMPSNDHSSSLNGGHLGEFSPPIFQTNTLDLHWDVTKADDDFENLFCAGRPRWWSHYKITFKESKDDANVALKSLIELAYNLLTGDQDVNDSGKLLKVSPTPGLHSIDRVHPTKVAIFTCRFSLGKFSKLSSLLAKHSLATITYVSSNRELVGSNYPSEPILAEASARYTNDKAKLVEVLSHVLASFHNEPKLLEAPRGDLGEMCAAALLGFTMDNIRQDLGHENMSQAVPLKTLLSVFDCCCWQDNRLTDIVGQWEVNFTHFVRPCWVPTEPDLLFMWKRRMAYYVPAGVNGLDLLVAIKRGDKEPDMATYGTLRIQVKNYSNKITNGARSKILSKLWPESCPPLIQNETFSVGLLLCLGNVESCCNLYNYDTHRLLPSHNDGSANHHATPIPKRLVLQLATTFPNSDALRENTSFQHVAIAAPLLAKIGSPSSEEVQSNDFEQDSLYQKIASHRLGKKPKLENSDDKK